MILQFFAAFIGAAGFGFLFHLQFKHIFPAALGGVLTWVIYVIATTWGFDVFISSLFASAFAAIYSEVIAKIRKAPTTLFLIISRTASLFNFEIYLYSLFFVFSSNLHIDLYLQYSHGVFLVLAL